MFPTNIATKNTIIMFLVKNDVKKPADDAQTTLPIGSKQGTRKQHKKKKMENPADDVQKSLPIRSKQGRLKKAFKK